ncbi:MAG: hypothetical protein IV100_14970 [Myxococcales bacterium]|nr:hypothetical protein [Myxococcales bacterium]
MPTLPAITPRLLTALMFSQLGCSEPDPTATSAQDVTGMDAVDVGPPDSMDDTVTTGDGPYSYTFTRGKSGALVVDAPNSLLYGFQLELDGDELPAKGPDTLTVTVSIEPSSDSEGLPTITLLPHGTTFSKPVLVHLPFGKIGEPTAMGEERLVLLRRRSGEGAPEELVTSSIGLAHHPVSGWRQLGPWALRPGPTPVGWRPLAFVRNDLSDGTPAPRPQRLVVETLGFSTLRGELLTRHSLDSNGTLVRSIACQADADCHDGMPCSKDTCVELSGTKVCTWTWSLPGAACDDGDPATSADRCGKYLCAGVDTECAVASDCDDGNPCTSDGCTGGLCVSSAESISVPCDDGDAASVTAACKNGECVAHESACVEASDCDDGNSCTVDSCSGNQCGAEPLSAGSCDDGAPATTPDQCYLGLCIGQPCGPAGQPCSDPTIDCRCEQGTVDANADCTWGDADECTGFISAVCYDECGGWADQGCFTACHDAFDASPGRSFPSGASFTADECTLTLTCP